MARLPTVETQNVVATAFSFLENHMAVGCIELHGLWYWDSTKEYWQGRGTNPFLSLHC